MVEYINREAAIAKCREIAACEWNHRASPVSWADAYEQFAEDIEEIQAADVAPVRHARWDENGRCSNCGGHAPFWCMASTYYKSPWCQECGAIMDLEG